MDPRVESIAPEDYKEFLASHGEDVFLLDVRMPYEFAEDRLEGATNFPYQALIVNKSAIPQDKLVLCYCLHGIRSMKSAKLLVSRGYDRVAHIEGGLTAIRALE